jgi:hypothetical protein
MKVEMGELGHGKALQVCSGNKPGSRRDLPRKARSLEGKITARE